MNFLPILHKRVRNKLFTSVESLQQMKACKNKVNVMKNIIANIAKISRIIAKQMQLMIIISNAILILRSILSEAIFHKID